MAAEERDDLDLAWARIVEGYHRDAAPDAASWPAAEDVDDEPSSAVPESASMSGATWREREREQAPAREAEHHFVPPEPPPLPRPATPTAVAWAGLLGGPTLLLLATVLGWELPTMLTGACVVGFVGGLVWLVAHLDDGSRRDGWDDGAQV